MLPNYKGKVLKAIFAIVLTVIVAVTGFIATNKVTRNSIINLFQSEDAKSSLLSVTQDTQYKYKITYNSNGGTWLTGNDYNSGTMYAEENAAIPLPIDNTDVEKVGHHLVGWFKDTSFTMLKMISVKLTAEMLSEYF